MRNTISLKFYSDPSHGWLKVPISLLKFSGIKDEITNYSYLSRGFAFLEEDCDAGRLVNALQRLGVEVKVCPQPSANKQSKIRGYDVYTPVRIGTS